MNGVDPTIAQGPASLTMAGAAGAALLVATALICLLAALRRRRDGTREFGFWLLLAALLVLATAYRLSGWEHGLGNDLRALAQGERWYRDRRLPQAFATIITLFVMGGTAAALVRYRADLPRAVAVGALATLALAALYVVRVVSLHLVDALLYADLGPLRINWAAEAILLTTIAAAAAKRTGRAPRPVRMRRKDFRRW